MNKFSAIIIILFCFNTAFCQNSDKRFFEFGIDLQQYPTGFLTGLRAEFGPKAHHSFDLRIGFNSLDHMDFGVQDSEIGGGFGGSLGYRYYFNEMHKNWFIGPRVDFWNNIVDWQQIMEDTNELIAEGTSNLLVVQPTLIGGYRWQFNEHFALTPTLAAGFEINAITDGEEIGQGAILLWGLNITYRL